MEALLLASKQVAVEVKAEKTKYCMGSCVVWTECRTKLKVKRANKSLENVAKFKYSVMTLTNENKVCIDEFLFHVWLFKWKHIAEIKHEQIRFGECLLQFGPEYFVITFGI
jgi:hypothetical protein